jgi:ribosomal silencing factor RsfS
VTFLTHHCVRFSSSGRGPAAGLDHDDFVESAGSSVVSSSSSAAGSEQRGTHHGTLGVVRDNLDPQYVERSRLGIPVEEQRNGLPPPRDNSRALTLHEINEHLAACEGKEQQHTNAAASPDGTFQQEFHKEATQDMKSHLPFDDEEFAETILAMEVEGALDEAWQDGKKAHLEDVKELVEILREMRVRNIAAIDVSQKTSSFDFIINGTCEGARHIHLAAWAISEADKNKRVAKIPRQKTDHLWEVIPVGRIVVNLMQESYRNEVNLERKWAVTKSMDPLQFAQAPVSEGRHSRAHGLWTLTLNLQDLEDFEVDYCKDVLLSQR